MPVIAKTDPLVCSSPSAPSAKVTENGLWLRLAKKHAYREHYCVEEQLYLNDYFASDKIKKY